LDAGPHHQRVDGPNHASPRAALKYQHATEERDEKVAGWIDGLVEAATAKETAERRASVTPIAGSGAG
jgi:hypothetical protein